MSTSFSADNSRYGYDFIGPEYIPQDCGEFYLRDIQLAELYKTADSGLVINDIRLLVKVLETGLIDYVESGALGGKVALEKGFFFGERKKPNGKPAKGEGLKHIIEERAKENLDDSQIAALLCCLIDTIKYGCETSSLSDKNSGYAKLELNGFIAILSKRHGGTRSETWLVTGFINNDKKAEATGAIKTVIAKYGYTPEHSLLCNQVGAALLLLNLVSQPTQKKSSSAEHSQQLPQPETPNPQPATCNPQPATQNLKPQTRPARTYRHLTQDEIETLKSNGSHSQNWNDFFVRDPFDAALVRNSFFAGLVRLGRLQAGLIRHHDYALRCGIENSRIISCDIGDDCALYDCRYLAHYIIGDAVILASIDEMSATNHAKFGEGILKEGEDEAVRITIDLLNETGGRAVLPFRDMLPADAYLWTIYRDDAALMKAFFNITQNSADPRRGFYGVIGHGVVIKHCRTIKDIWVGDAAYIKGANKLKNLTIKSDKRDPAQIGEGVELVNGIIGYGCRVFYGCKAVRFVLGDNCALKYGARLIHSVLGDNSTISCCEVLNNLVFPAHEQHHNNSFLIATMIMGQSNMAAGATVGSNHNSRGNDGEIIAGRGFWPGLSSALKHNSRFASFTLIAKGIYPAELDIPLPFCLLTSSPGGERRELMPAYWWLYNMYALERNNWKFKNRDKRVYKTQHIELDYLAPDTVNEIIRAMELLEEWAGEKDLLSGEFDGITLNVGALERSSQPVRIIKPAAGYRAYREMLIYYAVKTLVDYDYKALEKKGSSKQALPHTDLLTSITNKAIKGSGKQTLMYNDLLAPFIGQDNTFDKIVQEPFSHLPSNAHKQDVDSTNLPFKAKPQSGGAPLPWVNMGGQLVPEAKAFALMADVREGRLTTWSQIHSVYDKLWKEYPADKAVHALEVLEYLQSKTETSNFQLQDVLKEVIRIQKYIEEQVYETKQKDYTDQFRNITYRNAAERDAALGKLEDNAFIKISREQSAAFITKCEKLLCG